MSPQVRTKKEKPESDTVTDLSQEFNPLYLSQDQVSACHAASVAQDTTVPAVAMLPQAEAAGSVMITAVRAATGQCVEEHLSM